MPQPHGEPKSGKTQPMAPPSESSPRRVLVVDDSQAVVELVSLVLTDAGFSVETTTNAVEALARIKRTPHAYAALVTDDEMPFIAGRKLIDMAWLAGFQGKTVLHSGHSPHAGHAEPLQVADAEVMKPTETATLGVVLRQLLG